MKKSVILLALLTTFLMGAGYQIPNTSINSVALSNANIAYSNGADNSYYNPANMIYNEDKHQMEFSLAYVYLTPINYKSQNNIIDINSKKTTAWIPNIHYVSKKLNKNGTRVGLSIVSPAGLSRAWDDFPAVNSAKLYSLKTMECGISFAIPISKKVSFGAGFRYVYASGEVEAGQNAVLLDMKGNGDGYGYNLALTYKPTKKLNIAITYRSHISINVEGDSNSLYLGKNGDVSLSVPIPANFIIATSYTFDNKTTLELTYDRTMWSIVKETNFNFKDPVMEFVLGKPKEKKWDDTQAFRVGITKQFDSLRLMGGFAYSTNASNSKYVSFSSPESNSLTFSLGTRYNVNEKLNIGIATLYSKNKTRYIFNDSLNGTFSNKSVYTVIIGGSFSF